MIDLAEIFRLHWPEYERRYGSKLLPSHRRAVKAILQCRTPALGGEVYQCGPCHRHRYVYHSCNHRGCPKCGHHQATQWIQKQKSHLLPVPYFMVTFTLPSELREYFSSHQKDCCNLLFAASSQALRDVAANPKYLGAQIGMMGILQTWTRDLRYHLHIHYLVPAGGLSEDGLRWIRLKFADYLAPEGVLAARFKTLMKQALQEDHPLFFKTISPKLWQKKWVVDVLQVGRGEAALKYLSAYIYKTAITAQRFLACNQEEVSFRYRDAKTGHWEVARLTGEQFLQRFLQHVLPRGFARIRYYGWRSAAALKRWERILALLDWKPPLPPLPLPAQLILCPQCHQPMVFMGKLARPPP